MLTLVYTILRHVMKNGYAMPAAVYWMTVLMDFVILTGVTKLFGLEC